MASEAEYPLTVVYCPNCGMPPEFCEYSKSFEKCKPWLKDNFPHLYPHIFAPSTASGDGTGAPTDVDAAAAGIAAVSVAGVAAAGAGAPTAAADKTVDDGKKKRGGGKAKKPAKAVVITKRERGRGKCVTSITGLDGFDVKLKEAASALGKKFGTGATVTKNAMNEQEVDVQGDLMYELPEVLEALFGIPEDAIIVKD